MLFTASTIKDSLDNVRFFVSANLASGVDHMVIFVDAPRQDDQPEVADYLDEHPQVTCVRTDRREWWGEDRPAGLNVRQRINANWTRSLLEPFDWAEWLFHIDGDEVARLPQDALSAVPSSAGAVWLPPLEAVSRPRPEGRPTRFKRLLSDDDLTLLQVLGLIETATNQTYFHGHVMGKSGVRPASGLALTLHEVVSPDGVRQVPHEDVRLGLLHYDAVSGEEFIRKWQALAGAGPARYRASRAPVARALKRLVAADLPAEVREKYLHRIYEQTTQDDVETLGELGLLEEVDPLQGGHTPRELPPGAAEQLAARIDETRRAAKRPFFVTDNAKDGESDSRPPERGLRGPARRLRRMVPGA